MPKVTEEHREQVRGRILAAAVAACAQRPAYDVTMRDVIREAGLSPGAVYSYYRDIDSLWVDFLNSGPLPAEETVRKELERGPEEALGDYTDRLLKAQGRFLREIPLETGKIFFELDTKRATHPEFAQKRREGARPVLWYHAMVEALTREIRRDEAEGKIHPRMGAEDVALFVQAAFDGIMRDMILERCYGLKKSAPLDGEKLTEALAVSVRALLGAGKDC